MIGESFTRRRRRYSRDLQPCRRTRFSTRCAWNVYNDPRNEQFETGTISPQVDRDQGVKGAHGNGPKETRSGAVIKQ